MGNSKSAMLGNKNAKNITRRYAKHRDVTEDPSLVQNMVGIVQSTAPAKRRNKIAKLRKAVLLPPEGLSKNSSSSIAQQVRAMYKVGNTDAAAINNRQTLISLFGNPSSPNSFVNALASENMGTYQPIARTGVRVTKQLASAAERPVLSELTFGNRLTDSELAQKRQAALKKAGRNVRRLMSQQKFNAVNVAKYASTNIKTLLGKKEKDAAAAEQIRLRLRQLSSSATNVNGMKKELGIQNLSKNNAFTLTEIIMKEQLRRQMEGEGVNKKLTNLAKNVASMSAGLGSQTANTRSEQLEGFLLSRTKNTNRLKVIQEALQKHVLGVTYPNEDDFKKAKAVISFQMMPLLPQKSFRDALRGVNRIQEIPIYPLLENYDKLYDSVKELNATNANTDLNKKKMLIKKIATNLTKMNAVSQSLTTELSGNVSRAKTVQKERKAQNAEEIGRIESANLARQAQTLQNKQLQRNTVQVYNAAGSNIEIPAITFQNMITRGIDGRWVLGQTNEFNGGKRPKWFTINKGNSRGYSLTAYPPQKPTGNVSQSNAGRASSSNAGNASQRNNVGAGDNATMYTISRGGNRFNDPRTKAELEQINNIPPEGLFVWVVPPGGEGYYMTLQPNRQLMPLGP